MDLQKFYKGKRVLITGHTGFKGSWLAHILLGFGAKVSGYSLAPNTEPNLYTALKLSGRLEEKIADIRDYPQFEKFFLSQKPDIVFHLAAQPLVRDSYDDPLYTFDTNVMGTANVLEAIRKSESVKSGVMITTDKVYENKNLPIPYSEGDELGGHDPYSSSKVCAEFVVRSYMRSFINPGKKPGCLIASARAGNVIGGGDWSKDRLVPDIIKSKYGGTQLLLRNPGAIRPWQHVLDPLFGYMILAKGLYEGKTSLSGAYNFAPKDENFITVQELVKKSGARYEVQPDETKHEMQILKLDASKARRDLGFSPCLGINDTLSWTFGWYDGYYGKKNAAKLADAQIDEYLKLLQ